MVLTLSTKGIIFSRIGYIVINNLNKKNKTFLILKEVFNLAEEYNMEIDDFIYFYGLANIFIKTKMFNLIKEIHVMNTKVILFDNNISKYKNIIIYFHGGGYCAGSPEIYYDFLKKINNKIQKDSTNFILIDYKKLPNYNLNQVIHLTYEVYNKLIKMINDKNIILMGDSAGANLALQITNLTVKNNKNIPNHLICLSPWIISEIKGKYWKTNLHQDYLTPYTINLAQTVVLNSTNYSEFDPLTFNYDNFPNMLVRAGSKELILDEIYALIDKVKKSKCSIKYQIVKNMYHSFDLYYAFSRSDSPDYDKLINYLNLIIK